MVGGSIIRFCPVEGSGKRLRFTKRVGRASSGNLSKGVLADRPKGTWLR